MANPQHRCCAESRREREGKTLIKKSASHSSSASVVAFTSHSRIRLIDETTWKSLTLSLSPTDERTVHTQPSRRRPRGVWAMANWREKKVVEENQDCFSRASSDDSRRLLAKQCFREFFAKLEKSIFTILLLFTQFTRRIIYKCEMTMTRGKQGPTVVVVVVFSYCGKREWSPLSIILLLLFYPFLLPFPVEREMRINFPHRSEPISSVELTWVRDHSIVCLPERRANWVEREWSERVEEDFWLFGLPHSATRSRWTRGRGKENTENQLEMMRESKLAKSEHSKLLRSLLLCGAKNYRFFFSSSSETNEWMKSQRNFGHALNVLENLKIHVLR